MPRLSQGWRRVLPAMQRGPGNAESRADSDRTQSGKGLNASGHQLLPSLSSAAIGIPNNDETFF